MSWIEISVLIVSGIFVGFINTLAGGGTIISISLFMFMGLPTNMANGAIGLRYFFTGEEILDARVAAIL